MSTELSGSTVLVTGGTAGIGRTVALRFAALGAEVVVHGRHARRGADAVEDIRATGGRARFIAADLADPDAVRRLAAEAGEVDVLVNNAGMYRFASTPEGTTEMFDTHMAVNTRAPLQLVGALAPGMAAPWPRSHRQHEHRGRHHPGARRRSVRRLQGRAGTAHPHLGR
ncbi:SDR family NAD(P)-dependent oxidoreductase [Streptomyces coffeae]|uniref:SDR family NAD(P)-dependent oxidoreductase n=1 Tax=Streptomyces coffeae TaxID=621382 RepID=UPI0027DD8558|nr:SDR family oxidoreductase [Streptomyces coffeae]